MRKILLFLVILSMVASAAAEVQYSIDSDEDRVLMNSTIELECDFNCPGLTWTLVDDAKVIGVRDGRGEVEYEISGDEVKIEGRRSYGSDTRVIEIRSRIDNDAEVIHEGLYKRTLRLSGFEGERTSGTVSSGNLISGRTGFGFDMSFSSEEMVFQGDGPVNIRMKFGDGFETDYFSFFGAEPSDTEIAYEVPVGTLGVVQEFRRFPVAVHTDESYDRNVNEWSAGEYVSGAIQIRNQESAGDDFLPVLSHEVVHGLNDRILNWDHTRSSYFDEGTGKYVEFLVKKKLYNEGEIEEPPRELFGESVRYDPDSSDGKYYRLPPKGDKEQLWSYYENDRDFMKTWSAMNADPDTRKFGYAYSELVIRNYVKEGGSLRELYQDINVDQEIDSPEVKWQIYSEPLDMTPCKYNSREKFDQCLKDINSYNYPVYSAKPDRSSEKLQIERLEVPNRTMERGAPQLPDDETGFGQFLTQFFEYWLSHISALVQDLATSV